MTTLPSNVFARTYLPLGNGFTISIIGLWNIKRVGKYCRRRLFWKRVVSLHRHAAGNLQVDTQITITVLR